VNGQAIVAPSEDDMKFFRSVVQQQEEKAGKKAKEAKKNMAKESEDMEEWETVNSDSEFGTVDSSPSVSTALVCDVDALVRHSPSDSCSPFRDAVFDSLRDSGSVPEGVIMVSGEDFAPTPVCQGVCTEHFVSVTSAKDRGHGQINSVNKSGKSALMISVENGHVSTVRTMLELGAMVHECDASGATALMYAAKAGRVELVELLARYGADKEAVDHSGCTPLMAAAAEGHTAVVKYLLTGQLDASSEQKEDHELAAALVQIEELEKAGQRATSAACPPHQWICTTCTLLNANYRRACDACETARTDTAKSRGNEAAEVAKGAARPWEGASVSELKQIRMQPMKKSALLRTAAPVREIPWRARGGGYVAHADGTWSLRN
jgi:hypothetical protein